MLVRDNNSFIAFLTPLLRSKPRRCVFAKTPGARGMARGLPRYCPFVYN
jgi:hypothetical protein